MTRKQVINADELLQAAEYLLHILDVSKLNEHSLFVDNAMERVRKAAQASREPFKTDNGQELPFKK
jgi:hypothetical protein